MEATPSPPSFSPLLNDPFDPMTLAQLPPKKFRYSALMPFSWKILLWKISMLGKILGSISMFCKGSEKKRHSNKISMLWKILGNIFFRFFNVLLMQHVILTSLNYDISLYQEGLKLWIPLIILLYLLQPSISSHSANQFPTGS